MLPINPKVLYKSPAEKPPIVFSNSFSLCSQVWPFAVFSKRIMQRKVTILFIFSILQQKKNKEALDIFKTNYDKNPNQFTTLIGLTRGYSANGDYKSALKYAQQALPLAPDTNNKNSVQTMIDKLKDGKDVNL